MSDIFDQIMNIAMPAASKAEKGNQEIGGELIEALSTALGRSIARIANGDKETFEALIVGCECYIQDEAVSTSETMRLLKLGI